ncbi:uncharacterized protein K02A2.6-like isoform X1 [Coccinella septempunctata]|uniref:uncharacterized protein K02A2.6-like isoform X1 n=1 Tax=Coccinella septempunctata TaxID=41139 RepID=UPI001D090BA9|nr:uncharacterized protein K02A2.6-like isoform X1 [Coccinella septempunctata]
MTIFGQNKPIPQFSANRLRRWAVILSNYQYEVEYVKSENNTADALSRLSESESDSLSNNDDVEFPYCNFLTNSEEMPINLDEVKSETVNDKGLSQVIEFMKMGWPKYVSNDDMIKPYFSRRSEFAVSNNCLFWNHRIVVPVKLRHIFLRKLHMTHFGIVKSKNIARAHFWWPNLDKDVENYVKRCESCRKNLSNPAKVPLATWSWPGEVWERLHIDYFGPFSKKYYLIILDAHSKWVEVFETSTTSSEATIKMLRSCFARFGLPKTVVSDNDAYFTSEQFEFFLKKNNIKHVLIPPYHPESNGAAENCVKRVKNSIKKAMSEKTSVDTHTVLSRFLFDYRTTEHCTTGVSPDQIMFCRNLRTRFNALLYKPSKELVNKVHCKQQDQKKYYKGKNSVDYQVNDLVLVKDYRDVNKTNWIKGKIRKKIGRATFLVHILELDRCWKRHANQLRKTSENIIYPSERIVSNFEKETKNKNVCENDENVFESIENVFKSNENVILDKTDRPKRVRKPPERFQAE